MPFGTLKKCLLNNTLSKMHDFGTLCRIYIISSLEKRYETGQTAFDYCKSKRMGLAMWHTAELYEDIKYMASKTQSDLYTALSNIDNRDCSSKESCHGKLIWKQRANGEEEYFETNSAFSSITAQSDADYRAQVFKINGDVEGTEYSSKHKVVCGGKSLWNSLSCATSLIF